MSPTDAVWDELGKIDYLLDQLARAVERREIEMAAYERLAPRYLTRRAGLAAVIDARAGRGPVVAPAAAPAAASAAVPTPAPAAAEPTPAPVATAPGPSAVDSIWNTEYARAAASSRQPQPAPVGSFEPMARAVPPRAVPWPTVLTFVGAFLVIVASAIFAVAAWGNLGVGAKLGFLGLLTLGFYGWSEVVRARIKSQSGSVALAVVAAAMLVFDGWIAIDGYHLTGPLPWAVLALVCSLVYWAMELRIAGGVFGAIGAAAQVAWWWLLGARFDWPTLWIAAGLAVVAVVWDMGARRVPDGTPASTLASVLKWAAPIAAVLVIPLGVQGALSVTPVVSDAVAAVVLAAAVVAVLRSVKALPPGAGAIGSLPLLVVVSTIDAATLGPSALVLLVAVAAGFAAWEARVRGWSYAVLSLYFEFLVVARVADTLKANGTWTHAMFAVLAFAWIAVASALDTDPVRSAEKRWPGVVSLRRVSEYAGWGALALLSLTVWAGPLEAPPLLGYAISASHVALAAFCTLLWFGALAIRRRPMLGAFAVAGTFYTLAALMAWRLPDLHAGWYALGLVGLATVWSQSRSAGASLTRLPLAGIVWGTRGIALLIGVLGLVAAIGWGSFQSWATVAMFAGCAVFWAADALRDGEAVPLLFAPAALVAALGMASRIVWGRAYGAPAGALVALVCVEVAFTLMRRAGTSAERTRFWAIGASAAGTLAAATGVVAGGSPRLLSVAFVIAGVAWMVSARATRLPALTAIGGVVATLGIPALGQAAPLTAAGVTASHVLVAAAVAAVWLVAGRLERWPAASAAGIAFTFYALAGVLSRWAPAWPVASAAAVLVVFGIAWLAVGSRAERAFGLTAGQLRVVCVGAVALSFVLGGEASAGRALLDTWPFAALLLVTGAFALLDSSRARDMAGVVVGPVLLVAAAAVAGIAGYHPALGALLARPDAFAAAASLAALALALAGRRAGHLLATRDRVSVRLWTLASTITATAACLAVLDPLSGGAIAVGVLTLAWVAAVVVCAEPALAWAPAAAGLWWALAVFDLTHAAGGVALTWLVVYAYLLALPSFVLRSRVGTVGRTLAGSLLPVAGACLLLALGASAIAWQGGSAPAVWLAVPPEAFAIVLAVAGAWVAACAWAWSVEPGYYAGAGLVVAALLVEFDTASVTTVELYTVPVGLYLIAMGYLFARLGEGRRVPPGTDLAGIAVLVGVPAVQTVVEATSVAAVGHAWWAVALSLVAIAAGVALRCRTYFFGGVVALLWTALFRSWDYLVAYWWIVLGVVGIGLLVFALTWERRRLLVDGTKRALEGWR